mmetsp:Transcript_12500/g.34823  ORF Transcript_12500/g.34823 Transcript_12500/m.34823 type:complete len:231 (-) Transcript_12500:659-1351(-)
MGGLSCEKEGAYRFSQKPPVALLCFTWITVGSPDERFFRPVLDIVRQKCRAGGSFFDSRTKHLVQLCERGRNDLILGHLCHPLGPIPANEANHGNPSRELVRRSRAVVLRGPDLGKESVRAASVPEALRPEPGCEHQDNLYCCRHRNSRDGSTLSQWKGRRESYVSILQYRQRNSDNNGVALQPLPLLIDYRTPFDTLRAWCHQARPLVYGARVLNPLRLPLYPHINARG